MKKMISVMVLCALLISIVSILPGTHVLSSGTGLRLWDGFDAGSGDITLLRLPGEMNAQTYAPLTTTGGAWALGPIGEDVGGSEKTGYTRTSAASADLVYFLGEGYEIQSFTLTFEAIQGEFAVRYGSARDIKLYFGKKSALTSDINWEERFLPYTTTAVTPAAPPADPEVTYNWFAHVITAGSVPAGTQYLKIEVKNTSWSVGLMSADIAFEAMDIPGAEKLVDVPTFDPYISWAVPLIFDISPAAPAPCWALGVIGNYAHYGYAPTNTGGSKYITYSNVNTNPTQEIKNFKATLYTQADAGWGTLLSYLRNFPGSVKFELSENNIIWDETAVSFFREEEVIFNDVSGDPEWYTYSVTPVNIPDNKIYKYLKITTTHDNYLLQVGPTEIDCVPVAHEVYVDSSLSSATAAKGGAVDYDIDITPRTGAAVAGPVTISIPVPDGLIYSSVSVTGSGVSIANAAVTGGVFTAEVSNIPISGGTVSVTFTVVNDAATECVIPFTNVTADGLPCPEKALTVTNGKLPVTIDYDASCPSLGSAFPAKYPLVFRYVVTNTSTQAALNAVVVSIPLADQVYIPVSSFLNANMSITYATVKGGPATTIQMSQYTAPLDPNALFDVSLTWTVSKLLPGESAYVPDAAFEEKGGKFVNRYFPLIIKEGQTGTFILDASVISVAGVPGTVTVDEHRSYSIVGEKIISIEAVPLENRRMSAIGLAATYPSPTPRHHGDVITYTVSLYEKVETTTTKFQVEIKIPPGSKLVADSAGTALADPLNPGSALAVDLWNKAVPGSPGTPAALVGGIAGYCTIDEDDPTTLLLTFPGFIVVPTQFIKITYSVKVEEYIGSIRGYSIMQEFNGDTVTYATQTDSIYNDVARRPESKVIVTEQALKNSLGVEMSKYPKSDENGISSDDVENLDFLVRLTKLDAGGAPVVPEEYYTGIMNKGKTLTFTGLPPGKYGVSQTSSLSTEFESIDIDMGGTPVPLSGPAAVFTLTESGTVEFAITSIYADNPGFSSSSTRNNKIDLPNQDYTALLKYQLYWLASIQLKTGSGKGALPLNDAFENVIDTPSPYDESNADKFPHSIRPYFAIEAANAFLLDEDYWGNAKAYIDWHFAHINPEIQPGNDENPNYLPGTIYDYTYDFKGTELVTHTLNSLLPYYDSVDSYAALFLDLLYNYVMITEDTSVLTDPGNADLIELVYEALEACIYQYDITAGVLTRQPKGTTSKDYEMTIAMPEYAIEYLMDNVEVHKGLESAVELFKLSDINRLDLSASAAVHKTKVKNSLDDWFLVDGDPTFGVPYYRYYAGADNAAVGFDDNHPNYNDLYDFYPDALAQLFVFLYRAVKTDAGDPDGKLLADQMYASFCSRFEDWVLHDGSILDWVQVGSGTGTPPVFTDADWLQKEIVYPWIQISRVAALIGDMDRTVTSLENIQKRFRERTNPFPVTCQESADAALAAAAYMENYYTFLGQKYAPPLVTYYNDDGSPGATLAYKYPYILDELL